MPCPRAGPARVARALEQYIKRLEALEELAASKQGVEKVYALQAGREIRVIVSPGVTSTTTRQRFWPTRSRAKIEDRLEYPGQVKVTVIRESRGDAVAKNQPAAADRGRSPTAAGVLPARPDRR